jgi:hypothetical protein
MIGILTGVILNPNDVLMCTFFMADDVDHVFRYLSVIYTSSFINDLFNSVSCLLIGLLILLVFNIIFRALSLYIDIYI